MVIENRAIPRLNVINWWKGKPLGSIACTRKQQPRFYWSCSSTKCGQIVGNKLYFRTVFNFIPIWGKTKSYKHILIIYQTDLVPPEAGVHDDGDEEANHGDGDTHDGDETQGQGRVVSLEKTNLIQWWQ